MAENGDSRTAPTWVVHGLETLRERVRNVQEREALRVATLTFQAARLDEGIAMLREACPGLKLLHRRPRNPPIHRRILDLLDVCDNAGVAVPRRGGSVELSEYPETSLSTEDFFSSVLTLRNAMVHTGRPNGHDAARLAWLQESGLPYNLVTLTDDYIEEISFRMHEFYGTIAKVMQALNSTKA